MRGRALAVVALVVALALAGCAAERADGVASASGNGSQAGSGETDDTEENLSIGEKALRFAQCMRDHGVDMPDPEVDGNGGVSVRIGSEGQPTEDIDAAMEACRKYAPLGGEGDGEPDPQAQENMLKFAQCMRDNGVEKFPDPDGNRMTIDESVGGDPDFQAAQEKCAKEFLPGANFNSSGGATIRNGGGS